MSKIKGPGAVGAGASPVGEASPERPVADAAFTRGAGAAEAASASMQVLFQQVAEQLAAGQFADRTEAVRAAVDAVLDREMGHLNTDTRSKLATQVSAALTDHPDLSARLDRLLGA